MDLTHVSEICYAARECRRGESSLLWRLPPMETAMSWERVKQAHGFLEGRVSGERFHGAV